MMWFELRRETLAFLGRAPVVHGMDNLGTYVHGAR